MALPPPPHKKKIYIYIHIVYKNLIYILIYRKIEIAMFYIKTWTDDVITLVPKNLASGRLQVYSEFLYDEVALQANLDLT